MNFIWYLKSYYDVCEYVKVYAYSQTFHSIPCSARSALSFHGNFFLFTAVFVQFPLCSFFSFPYMEISNPVYIIAGIHQEMQFAHLPGSVMWRTACNCLSHHLRKKKSEKQLHQWQPWCSWKGSGSWRMGEKLFYLCCYLYCSLLMPVKHSNY